jgi:hypothetical protein
MGGGTDVDTAFQWLCQRAPGGDFLVVRAAGTDALADPFNRYNTFAQDFLYVEHLKGTTAVSEETAC